MVVVQLLPSMRRAGAESVVALLCRGLADAGVEVHLVVLGGRFDYHDELKDSSVKIHLLHLYEGPVRFYRLDVRRRTRKSLLEFLRQLHPDILHCHLSHALIWAAAAASRLGLKTFYTIHGLDPAMNGQGWINWWRKREFARAVSLSQCQMLAVTKSAARHAEKGLGLPPGTIAVQPNPIDLDAWQPDLASQCPDSHKVMMVGTLYPLKRVDIGIQALKLLSSTFPSVKMEIAGDGPERTHLEELARSLGLGPRVSFLGVRRDIPDLLKAAGVLWLLSEREGMPMAMLEAMASGLPVIAADVPGINEMITHEENGLLVPPDAPAAVAAATMRLLDDIPLRKRIIRGGRNFVSQFSLPNIVKQHLDHYSSSPA